MPRIMHTLRSFLTSSRRVRLLIGVLLVASAGLIANRVFVAYDESRARLDRHYLETTDDAARAIVASLSEFSRYVVEREITTPEILTAIGEGIKSGDLETARSFLRDELGELYETLREFQFNQLHVHLPDGRSLLRMNAPDVWGDSLYGVRESVAIVQRERRPVSSFEAGRISTGYRFVYPLAWEGEDLGSVELSSSFDTIAAALFEEFDKPGELLVRRETLDEALLDNEAFRYGETPLAQEYLVDYRTVEGAEPAWVDRVRREIHGRSTIRGASGVDIVVPVSIDRVGYAVVMLSVEDVRGAHVGYFVTYQQTDEYRALLAETSERAILIGLALGALVLVLLLANRARELAVSANRSKSQFLANVSHELRTPMSGVMGMIEALEEPGTSKAERTEYLRLLRGACNDMVHIVNSILEMSRIEAGRVELHREPFAPATVIGDMVDSMRTSEIAGGLEIRFSADDEAYRRVMGDPLRLRQIVTNVFHNALKFTQEGGVTVGVSTRVRDERAAMVEVTVTDTGIGIPEEQLPQIFEKFAQGTSAITQTYGGSGLGLSIVKSLVDLMGGGIQISSLEGVGTTVYVKLPCELATGSDERRPAVGVRPEPAPSRTPPMKPPVAGDPSEVRDTKR
ncbi:MAG: ATP-binding protein, partial [Spirochaetota bacterium]